MTFTDRHFTIHLMDMNTQPSSSHRSGRGRIGTLPFIILILILIDLAAGSVFLLFSANLDRNTRLFAISRQSEYNDLLTSSYQEKDFDRMAMVIEDYDIDETEGEYDVYLQAAEMYDIMRSIRQILSYGQSHKDSRIRSGLTSTDFVRLGKLADQLYHFDKNTRFSQVFQSNQPILSDFQTELDCGLKEELGMTDSQIASFKENLSSPSQLAVLWDRINQNKEAEP